MDGRGWKCLLDGDEDESEIQIHYQTAGGQKCLLDSNEGRVLKYESINSYQLRASNSPPLVRCCR